METRTPMHDLSILHIAHTDTLQLYIKNTFKKTENTNRAVIRNYLKKLIVSASLSVFVAKFESSSENYFSSGRIHSSDVRLVSNAWTNNSGEECFCIPRLYLTFGNPRPSPAAFWLLLLLMPMRLIHVWWLCTAENRN